MTTLPNLANMSREDLLALVATLASNTKEQPLTMKVSEKGAISIYGFGRWPVTLYKSQMVRLVELVKSGKVEAFMQANAHLLTEKAPKSE